MGDDTTLLSQLTDPGTVPLLFATARNMRARQLAGIGGRILRQFVVPSLPIDFDDRYERAVPPELTLTTEAIRGNTTTLRGCLSGAERRRHREWATAAAAGDVTFLNHTVRVDGSDGVDWMGEAVLDPPPLWALKFHGFEFLRWAYLGHDSPDACPAVARVFRQWLEDWQMTDETRIGHSGYLRGAWTPHAVSLRVLNTARFCSWIPSDSRLYPLAARLLYRNAAFLSNHVEYDVDGNHLIENGAALVMAGIAFKDVGDEWLSQGIDVLTAASEQFLPDGGHFELSPMYHVQCLIRYLTVVDLLHRTARKPPTELREVAASATRFLRAITPPDDRLPLLNDAVFDEVIGPPSCLAYADAVGSNAGSREGASVLCASGYYWLGDGDDRLLVDGGKPGPAHLPGHTHNDQLAVSFWADGKRLLTDSGTPPYAPTNRREYARSVRAHNTVQYGDTEPMAVGGSYLLGRRVEPSATVTSADGVDVFDGRYSREAPPRYSHRRRVYHDEDWWLVWDTVDADAAATVTSRLHAAPGVEVEHVDDGGQPRFELVAGESSAASVVPLGPSG